MTTTKIVAVAAAILLASTSAHADQRFLRAASYFLSGGQEHNLRPALVYGMETMDDGHETETFIIQDKDDPCKVHFRSRWLAEGTLKTVDFNKMPSPGDFGYSSFPGGIGGPGHRTWFTKLPPGAMVETSVRKDENDVISFVPTGKRWKELNIVDDPRSLRALYVIRNNYCPGLPEARGF